MKKGPVIGASVMLLLAVGIAFWGVAGRARDLVAVTRETRERAVPAVAIISPERGVPQEEVALPGTMQAYSDAPIYARTNGCLKRWYANIGAHVRAGQLLAEIDAPEVDQQLQQARADQATAEANARLVATADRYRDLITTDSVSRWTRRRQRHSTRARRRCSRRTPT